MNFSALEKIFNRARRTRKRLNLKAGEGTEWTFISDDNEIHNYAINGVKSEEEVQDDIETAFIWLWSLKDYIKKYSISKGYTANWIEEKINSDHYLCICADIANSVKHGGLDRRSRSNIRPKLGSLIYSVPQSAMESIVLHASKVVTNVKKPDLVILKMDIFDNEDNIIGDALEILDYGIKAWNEFLDEVESSV